MKTYKDILDNLESTEIRENVSEFSECISTFKQLKCSNRIFPRSHCNIVKFYGFL